MIIDELEAELREISNGMKLSICHGDEARYCLPSVFGKPLNIYFRELISRLRAARKEIEVTMCEPMLDNKPRIGDRCIISERWEAIITATITRASDQMEYQLEWLGEGELKSDERE